MKNRQNRRPGKRMVQLVPVQIEAESWIEALFLVVLQLRSDRANGLHFAENWLAGAYQIASRAEARGYELPAIEILAALISEEQTDEEAGIFLAALEAGGWITEQDFVTAFLEGME